MANMEVAVKLPELGNIWLRCKEVDLTRGYVVISSSMFRSNMLPHMTSEQKRFGGPHPDEEAFNDKYAGRLRTTSGVIIMLDKLTRYLSLMVTVAP